SPDILVSRFLRAFRRDEMLHFLIRPLGRFMCENLESSELKMLADRLSYLLEILKFARYFIKWIRDNYYVHFTSLNVHRFLLLESPSATSTSTEVTNSHVTSQDKGGNLVETKADTIRMNLKQRSASIYSKFACEGCGEFASRLLSVDTHVNL